MILFFLIVVLILVYKINNLSNQIKKERFRVLDFKPRSMYQKNPGYFFDTRDFTVFSESTDEAINKRDKEIFERKELFNRAKREIKNKSWKGPGTLEYKELLRPEYNPLLLNDKPRTRLSAKNEIKKAAEERKPSKIDILRMSEPK